MRKSAFESMVEGLKEAKAIIDGTADPSTYRVHYPKDGADKAPPPKPSRPSRPRP